MAIASVCAMVCAWLRDAIPEQGGDKPVRDNRRHKDQLGWRWQINSVVHSAMLRGHSGFFSVKRLVSSGSASGSRPIVNDVCVEDSFPRKRPLRVLPNAPHVM